MGLQIILCLSIKTRFYHSRRVTEIKERRINYETAKKLIMSFLTSDDEKFLYQLIIQEKILQSKIKSAMDLVVEKYGIRSKWW